MKTIVSAVITCVILFGISVMATKHLQQAESEQQSDDAIAQTDGQPQSDQVPEKTGAQMPVALRPDNAISVEAVLQMSDSIKKMEQQLLDRERRVVKKEQRVKLLFDDLATEQDELRAFSEGIDAKVDMLTQLNATLKSTLDTLETRKAELEDLAKQTGSDEASKQIELDNKVNDVKGWFENLQPEQAADYLKEFANNGKMEFAASLLQKMSDRQKSKILGVMSDPVLVDQLVDALSVRPKKTN